MSDEAAAVKGVLFFDIASLKLTDCIHVLLESGFTIQDDNGGANQGKFHNEDSAEIWGETAKVYYTDN